MGDRSTLKLLDESTTSFYKDQTENTLSQINASKNYHYNDIGEFRGTDDDNMFEEAEFENNYTSTSQFNV